MSNQTILHGDIRNLIKNIPDNTIELVVTDPPYKVTPKGCTGNTGGMMAKKESKTGMVFKHNDIKPQEYIPEFYRILKDGSHCYIMTNHVNLIEMLNVATDCEFHFIKSLIWDKGNKIMGRFYMSQFEYILFFRKGKGIQINNCGTPDILSIPNKKTKGDDGKNLHDTEKPVELMKILISNSIKNNGWVLDPFAGIGSTMLACKELDLNGLSFELDENYYNIAQNRLNGV